MKKTTNNIKNRVLSKNKSQSTKSSGITLIALVITIVILIILAGISIVAIRNNGIINRAKEAKNKTEIAQANENIQLFITDARTEAIQNGENLTLAKLHDKLAEKKNEIEVDDYANDKEELTGIYILNKQKYNFTIDKNFNLSIVENNTPKIKYEVIAIGTSNSSTNTKSVEDWSQTSATLYINIIAKLGNQICTVKSTTDNTKTVPYAVTKNGDYTFTISGIYNGKEVSENKTIKVKKYVQKLTSGVVQYDAGVWTQEEIDSLKSNHLYMQNLEHLSDGTFNLLNNKGLNFTFGGFRVGDSRNNSVDPQSGYGTVQYYGWKILKLNEKNGKMYVNSIVHSGSPENFVYYYTANYDSNRAEYLLSNGVRQKNYNKLNNGRTIINSRNWDVYRDKNLERKNMIKEVHPMDYDEANIQNNNDRNIGAYYFLSTTYNYYNIWVCTSNGNLDFYRLGYNCFGIRPVVTMQDGVYIKSGTGTESDPYILDKE